MVENHSFRLEFFGLHIEFWSMATMILTMMVVVVVVVIVITDGSYGTNAHTHTHTISAVWNVRIE